MPISLEELLDKIIKETGLTKEELQREMNEIIQEFENFIDEESAAHYLAQKHGIDLQMKPVDAHRRIKDLIPEMRNVMMPVKVLKLLNSREFTRKTGEKGLVANLVVADETGTITLVLWDKQAQHVSDKEIDVNDVLMITGGYIKQGIKGEMELHVGNNGGLRLNPADMKIEVSTANTKSSHPATLSAGMTGISLKGIIRTIYPLRTFTRKDNSTGKTVSLILQLLEEKVGKDENQNTLRLACWDDHAEKASTLQVGDTVQLENLNVREGMNSPIELHTSTSTQITVISHSTGSMPSGAPEPSSPTVFTTIQMLSAPSQNASLVATVTSVSPLREFARKDGTNGHLLSCTVGDKTGSVKLNLWDEHATTNAGLKEKEVLRIEHAYTRVGLKGEIELNLGKRGVLTVNPTGVKSPSMKDIKSTPPPLQIPQVALNEAKEYQTIQCTATLVRLYKGPLVYPACPKCYKKIVQIDASAPEGICSKCGKVKPLWTSLLSGLIDDGNTVMRVSMIGESAETLLNSKGAALQKEIEKGKAIEAILQERELDLLGKDYLFTGRVSRNMQTNLLELSAREVQTVDAQKETHALLGILKSRT